MAAIPRIYPRNIKIEADFLDCQQGIRRFVKIHLDGESIAMSCVQFTNFTKFLETYCFSKFVPVKTFSAHGFTLKSENRTFVLYYEQDGGLRSVKTSWKDMIILKNFHQGTLADLERLLYHETAINNICNRLAENLLKDLPLEDAKDITKLIDIFLTVMPTDLILKVEISVENYSRLGFIEGIIHQFPEVIYQRIWRNAHRTFTD